MGFFKRLFKRKEGGTTVGNLMRMHPLSIMLRKMRD